MKYLVSILTIGSLTACGPIQFNPKAYSIIEGEISPLILRGKAKVINSQPSIDQLIIRDVGGTQLLSTLNALTDSMVQQTQDEISLRSTSTIGVQVKIIEIKIDSLLSTTPFLTYHSISTLNFVAILGNGKSVSFTTKHSAWSPTEDLNGCIHKGVVQLLSNQEVREYLAE